MDDELTRDRRTWQSLFDEISQGRNGQLVTLEVLDQDFGDQTEAERVPFSSITYDERGDVVVVALGGATAEHPVVLRHLVHRPRLVDVVERGENGLVLRVVDSEDAATLVEFADQPA